MKCARPECGHPRAIHAGDACRIGGCPCSGFDDGAKRAAGPRRVSIDIPAGYSATITLAPVFATGGNVETARSYVVGEQGPEILMPAAAGTIQPKKGTAS